MSLKSSLNRSDQLQADLVALFDQEMVEDSDRYSGCRILCSVAIEYGESLRQLLKKKLATSAISLLRIQFETFVRATWLLHAAKDSQVSLIMDIENISDERKANSLPMLSEMIKEMEGKAPEPAVKQINELKTASWRYLSSHIHGGYYALHLHVKGVPTEHSTEILKMSNALLALTGIVLSSLSESLEGITTLRIIKEKYRDLFPEFN